MKRSIRIRVFAAIIFMAAAFVIFGAKAEAAPAQQETATMNTLEQGVLDAINTVRAQYGLPALKVNVALISDARVRAAESSIVWSHTRPDGTDWWTVDDSNMYSECLAKGYSAPDAVVEAWMNSKSHREQILRADLTSAAIGGYVNTEGNCYITFEGGF